MALRRVLWRAVKRVLAVLAVLLAVLLGYGLGAEDRARLDAFVAAERSWQKDPDFRRVGTDYARFASSAMQTRPMGIPCARLMVILRSIPGLPERYAIAPTSRSHYRNFSRGPLPAYLHLSGEQGLEGIVGAVERMGQQANLTDAEIRQFLISFNIYPEPATDAGAVLSVRRMLADIDARRPLVIRNNPSDRIAPAIESVLGRMDLPPDIDRLSRTQQLAALDRLDGEVRAMDYELWRTKQVNDLLGGIWAQTFGLMYTWLVGPYLVAHRICRVVAPLLIVALAVRLVRQRVAARNASAVRPRLASAGVLREDR